MKLQLLTLILLSIFSNCKNHNTSINGKFMGFWAETKWTYRFYSNGEYTLQGEGHGGGEPKTGKYLRSDSILVLLADTEYFDDFEYKRLILTDDNCLRDYMNNYYCQNEATISRVSKINSEEFLFTLDSIRNLDFVKEKIEELALQDSLNRPRLVFNGIKILNQKEFFKYELRTWNNECRRRQIHYRLHATMQPFQIYGLHNDSLHLIK